MTRLLITVPTWNEERIIANTLRELYDFSATKLGDFDVLIEVADNGSTDGTRAVVATPNPLLFQRQEGGHIRLLFKEISAKGKGLAVRRSWETHLNDFDVLLFTDADLAADLNVIPKMVELILSGGADVVVGSRFVGGAAVERRWHREAASRLFRLLQHVILGLPVQDAQCGLKAISAKAAKTILPRCKETGWLFDSELLFRSKKQFRIVEIPVAWVEHRDPSRRSAIHLFRDGWGFVTGLLRIRFF
jgi:glycosyltransferase involved in cell wall biosynthesis